MSNALAVTMMGVVTVAALVMRSAQAVTEANVSAAVVMTEAAAAVLVVKMVLVARALEAVTAAILVLWAREVTLESAAAAVRALMATEFMMVVANVAAPTAQSMTTAAIVVPWVNVAMPAAVEAIGPLTIALPRALAVNPEAAVAVMSMRQVVTAAAVAATAATSAVAASASAAVLVLLGANWETHMASKVFFVVPNAQAATEAAVAMMYALELREQPSALVVVVTVVALPSLW